MVWKQIGDVYSTKTQKILKKRYTQDGYIQYVLRKDNYPYTKRSHRLVAEAFIPIDGNKLNNHISNNEQMIHAYKLGLNQVKKIRNTYIPHSSKFGMRALSKKYNVSCATIDRCVRKIYYK